MGNNIKDFYLNAANNFHKPVKPTKKTFDFKSCSTQDLKAFKKLINAELKRRRFLNFNAFWQKHKKTILSILTLLVSFIGSIIIPLLCSK